VEAGFLQGVRDLGDKVRAAKTLRGDVDADAHRRWRGKSVPMTGLLACLASTHSSIDDNAGSSAVCRKALGKSSPRSGWCSEAAPRSRSPAVRELHDWLIMQHQLLPLDRAAEVPTRVAGARRRVVHGRVADGALVPCRRL